MISVSRWLLALYVVAILALTLAPVAATPDTPRFDFELSGFRTLADAFANVLLFVPFGALAAWAFGGWRPAVAGAFALSLFIEATQLLIPGRYTSPADLVFNTLGAVLGTALVLRADLWLRPPEPRRTLMAWIACAAALLVLTGGTRLFAPAFPHGTLYGQWTPVRSPLGAYQGRVLAARAGDVDIHSWQVRQSARLRSLLLSGDTVHVRVRVAAPTAGLVPIFSIADREWTLFSLAADGSDLVLSYRMRSTAIGLDQPVLRFPDGLADHARGDTARLAAWREDRLFCLAVDDRQRCSLGFTPGDTWGLILHPLPAGLAFLVPLLWLPALLAPAGFWIRRSAPLGAMAATVAAVLLFAPPGTAVRAAPAHEVALALAGLLLGHLAGRAAALLPPVRSAGTR
jgi:VanZ family protein